MNETRRHENGVEGLRGFAALCVLHTHFLWETDLDPGYSAWGGFMALEVSQGAVLLFFLLSGYVIGLTNQRTLGLETWRDYLRRRLVRLVPLCWLAIGLSVWARPGASLSSIGANLLFLQNEIPYGDVSLPLLRANTNLWTLHYEALYYLLFAGVWWRPHAWPWWMAGSFALSIAGWMLPAPWSPLITCYAVGWIFWLAGYALARTAAKEPASARILPLPWPSILLLWVVVWQIKPLLNVCRRFSALPPDSAAWINYSYFDFLPACLVLLLAASGRRPRWAMPLCHVAAAIPLLFMLWNLFRARVNIWPPDHVLVFSLLACALWKWRPDGVLVWSRLAWVGGISYGIYILQRPVQWFVHDAAWLPSGNGFAFTLRLVIAASGTFAIAWWAEKRLQPFLRRHLLRGRTASANPAAAPLGTAGVQASK